MSNGESFVIHGEEPNRKDFPLFPFVPQYLLRFSFFHNTGHQKYGGPKQITLGNANITFKIYRVCVLLLRFFVCDQLSAGLHIVCTNLALIQHVYDFDAQHTRRVLYTQAHT